MAFGPRDLLGEGERGPFALAEQRTLLVGVEGVELRRGDSCLHADGVTDIPSVRCPMQARDLHLEERPQTGVDRAEPFDGAVERSDAQHERDAMRHDSLGRRNLSEQPLADEVEQTAHGSGFLDLGHPRHGASLMRESAVWVYYAAKSARAPAAL